MSNLFWKWIRFKVERLMLRGASWRLLFIVCVIGLVCLVGGTAAFHLGGGQFKSWGEAVWWAFLRLTDPGYLGDDEGLVLRFVSTVVTVLGYVLFMGSLIAIMVQWLDATVRTMERGLTPVSVRHHVLILGWTNRTPIIVRELLLSEGRVRRFLELHNVQRLTIVILAEQPGAGLRQELRDYLGPLWRERQIIFRGGTPLREDNLARAAFRDASAIIVPGTDFAAHGMDLADAGTLKVLMALNRQRDDRLPYLSTEVGDVRRKNVVRNAYEGPVEVIASDSIVSLMLAQVLRHPGLSEVYNELLTSNGESNVYVRSCPELEGERIQDLGDCFPNAVVLGLVVPEGAGAEPLLNPPGETRLAVGGKLVFVASGYEQTRPTGTVRATHRRPGSPKCVDARVNRVLLMGWNDRIPLMLEEFGNYAPDTFEVDILSTFPVEVRERKIGRYGFSARNVTLSDYEGDYAVPGDLASLDLWGYDCIVVLGCDWLADKDEADARSIMGYRVLKGCLEELDAAGKGAKDAGVSGQARVVLELLDPVNQSLIELDPGEELVITPLILGHIQAHVALRAELNAVLHQLFCSGGPDIVFRPVADYGLGGATVSFGQIADAAMGRGDTALGIRRAPGAAFAGSLCIAPERDSLWELVEEDDLLVLSDRY